MADSDFELKGRGDEGGFGLADPDGLSSFYDFFFFNLNTERGGGRG